MNTATTQNPPAGQQNSPQDQASKLPPGFDPGKYPHYSVQSSIYSLLLSALSMAEHYERYPGAEERHRQLDSLVRDYQETCEPLRISLFRNLLGIFHWVG